MLILKWFTHIYQGLCRMQSASVLIDSGKSYTSTGMFAKQIYGKWVFQGYKLDKIYDWYAFINCNKLYRYIMNYAGNASLQTLYVQ